MLKSNEECVKCQIIEDSSAKALLGRKPSLRTTFLNYHSSKVSAVN